VVFCSKGANPAEKNFVACPIVRDTKTVPCWLAEYEGETYYLGIQQDIGADFFPPQLGHEVLVEGTVASSPSKARICGGIPLMPVTISVLREVNHSCNTILPAEEGIDAPAARRGAGPPTVRTSLGIPPPPPTPPSPSFEVREFTIPFDFDSDYLPPKSTRIVDDAVVYAKASHANVEVVGYRGMTLLSDGRTFTENAQVAELRAAKIADLVRGLGVSALAVKSEGVPRTGKRRVTILVRP
jgi:hypothetical protein